MGPEPITQKELRTALDQACERVRCNLPAFTYCCQNHSSVDLRYPPCENEQWTCGFWPGELWLAYEHTRDPVFALAGLFQVESFRRRILERHMVDHHDMGFLYTPSCVSAFLLTGYLRAKEAALLAADQLLSRFREKGSFIQAWGALDDAGNYRYIIDCLMNLPLLYWAERVTGNGRYRDAAQRHTATCLRYSFRPDGSTFHTFFMDPGTGAGVRGVTCQGYRDDSSWTRGQAWAIYGMALAWRHTKDPACRDAFNRALAFYLDRLPADMIPYWDLIFTDGDEEPRDSSSAAIVACGMLEMAEAEKPPARQKLIALAKKMVGSLYRDYNAAAQPRSNGLVLHGTYSKKSPFNTCTPEGVDECVSWGA